MNDNIEVTYRDALSGHMEQVVHNLLEEGMVPGPHTWPKPDVTVKDWQSRQIIVARVNGVVAGRAVLSSGYYPFAEFENFSVDPAYRGRGVGSGIVVFAAKRAAEMGYLALHLQTELDNRQAQRLYVREGFIPATQGQYLRMMRLLSYPALSRFMRDHPIALLRSEPGTRSPWELRWQDPASGHSLSILLSGGSAQADSDGYGPGVAGFEISDAGTAYSAEISGPDEVRKGSEFGVRVKLCNEGSSPITGACRLLLNVGFEPAEAYRESQTISVEPDSEQEIVMGVRLLESFDDDIMKVLTYRSAATAVEFLIGERVFWLSHEVKVTD